ncbi:MAG: PIG-L family deacetylase [Nitrospira sp.]|nr:PIG-L family deacetylase [Nitrospira sp.]MDH4329132.1 PIG-L family deacetylase [Nitrospira sp.]MDH5252533.1 PIG-L family deacetylase [Nitrospira sp.]
MSHNVVIVSAHPDDMEIGMGGTAAKLAESQAAVISVVITNGGRASNPFGWTEQRMAEVRREEALCAAKVLGVQEVLFLDQPDAAEEIDVHAVKQKLVGLLTRLQPVEVYTLDEELDRHPAHRLAGRVARDCVIESGMIPAAGLWAYEIWGPLATWNRLEYIDDYVAKKMLAIAEHRSQVATIPYGEGVLGLNRWRAVFADPKAGAPAGVYAEVFRRVALSPVSR